MQSLDWVVVDWGTSSLRLWGMAANGDVVFTQTSQQGMNTLSTSQHFEDLLLTKLAPYLHSAKPLTVVCCGMVGAKQGWQDAGYQKLPWQPDNTQMPLTALTNTDPRIQVYIVPGLCQMSPADVMRGEETQLAGLLVKYPKTAIVCLPGTHSKWVQIDQQGVTSFRTFMTGELFALLTEQSVLRFSMHKTGDAVSEPVADKATSGNTTMDNDNFDEQVFVETLQAVQRNPHKVVEWLFSIRAKDILASSNNNSKDATKIKTQGGIDNPSAYLSALLIGQELLAIKPFWQDHEVALVGGSKLTKHYQLALATLGGVGRTFSGEECVLAGLESVYKTQIVGIQP